MNLILIVIKILELCAVLSLAVALETVLFYFYHEKPQVILVCDVVTKALLIYLFAYIQGWLICCM